MALLFLIKQVDVTLLWESYISYRDAHITNHKCIFQSTKNKANKNQKE